MDHQPLDRPELERACREVVRDTLWQTPNPQNIHDIVDAGQIERLTGAYLKEALGYVEYVQEAGRDPNLITRAVRYLAAAHALPPMKEDISWFNNMLQALVELACPNGSYNREAIEFFSDIREGLAEVEEEVE